MGSYRGWIAKPQGTESRKRQIVLDHILLIGRELLPFCAQELTLEIKGKIQNKGKVTHFHSQVLKCCRYVIYEICIECSLGSVQ